MKNLGEQTRINVASLLLGSILVFGFGYYITREDNISQSRSVDSWGSDLGMVMAAWYFAGSVYVAALIVWSLRVLWVIISFWGRHWLVKLNVVILLAGWLPLSPSAAKAIAYRYWKHVNSNRRNEVVGSTLTYKTIKFPRHLKLESFIETHDSVVLALKE